MREGWLGWRRYLHGFPGRVAACLLGLATLYIIYAVGAYYSHEPGTPFAYRVVMVFGMATFPLPLLVAPAVYMAALDYFDLYGAVSVRVRRHHWGILAAIAMCAWAACASGPAVFDRALEAVGVSDLDRPREGLVAEGHARVAAPIAVGLFVFVSGVYGAVLGHATMGFERYGRFFARWGAGVGAFATFCVTLVGVGELITMYGVLSPLWLALAPPVFPLVFTAVLARDDCMRIVESVSSRLGFRRPAMDATAVDELLTVVIDADNRGSAAEQVARQGTESEVAALVSGFRRVGSARIPIDQTHVQKMVSQITGGLAEPARQSWNADNRGAVRWAPAAAAFVGSWICLSVGLLLLGGANIATPSMVSAAVAGLIGAGSTLLLSRTDLFPVPAATVAS